MGMFRTEIRYNNRTVCKDYIDNAVGLNDLITDVNNIVKANGLAYSLKDKIESLEIGNTTAFTINGIRVLITRVRTAPSLMTMEDIIKTLKEAKYNRKEWHGTVYNDGTWKIDMEIRGNGIIVYWASAEYADGTYKNTMVTPYIYNNEIRTSAEFKIKQVVLKKILNIYKATIKANIVTV